MSGRIVKDMPWEEYFAADGLNSTTLNAIALQSPAHAKWKMDHPDEGESEALKLGQAVHMALLEPDRFQEIWAIGPDVKLNTKAGKADWALFEGENEGKKLLRATARPLIHGILGRLRAEPALRSLCNAGGDYELSMFWKQDDVDAKGRVDKYVDGPAGHIVIDLKTCRSAHRVAMARAISDFGYARQAAWYRDGIKACLGNRPVIYMLVCVEKTPPYAISTLKLSEDALQVGANENRRLMNVWRRCMETGNWPDYSRSVREVGLPGWHEMVCDFAE